MPISIKHEYEWLPKESEYIDDEFSEARTEIEKLIKENRKIVGKLTVKCRKLGYTFNVFSKEELKFMSKDEFESIPEENQEVYLKIVKAIVFLRKVVMKDNSVADTPLIENNSFMKEIH